MKPKPGRRGKRAELPKPLIRPGTLGFYPLNPLNISYLFQEQGELILGYRDTTETQAFKARPVLHVQHEKGKEEFSLDGRFFNGFADALYRGKLCEVIIATPTEQGLHELLEDFVDYLEKLLALGFFVPKKEIVKRDPVADLIPHFILAGEGLLFSRFITALMRYLQELGSRHSILDEAMRTRILGRFVRGMPTGTEAQIAFSQNISLPAGARIVSLVKVPSEIRVAGGGYETHAALNQVLASYQLSITLENRARNAVERLEFENAIWRVTKVVIPALVDGKALSTDEVKKLAPKVEAGIMAIGRQRKAFDESDSVESVSDSADKPAKGKRKNDRMLSRGDASMLSGLGFYAEALGLPDEKKIFETLAERVAACCPES